MSGKILLDTNAVIAIFSRDQAVLDVVTNATECCVPAVVLGELCYGAYHSLKVNDNLARVAQLQETATVMPCDATTAREYGRVKSVLRTQGRPIPENDIWIAAIAIQHQIPLLTRDEHFNLIEGLDQLSW